MAFVVRPAAREDVPEILAMIRELADFESLTHLVRVTTSDLDTALFGPRPYAEAVIVRAEVAAAADAQESVGAAAFALYYYNFSTFRGQPGLYLEDLFVRPAFRRRGVGRSLLAYLARVAVARGCARFEWSVLDWNQPAIDFYASVGATVLPDWRITRLTGAELAALAADAPV